MGGGGGKSGQMAQAAPPPMPEAPKPYTQEQAMDEASQRAKELQEKRAKLALGQEGSIKTSPFGTQEQQQNTSGKTLLGG